MLSLPFSLNKISCMSFSEKFRTNALLPYSLTKRCHSFHIDVGVIKLPEKCPWKSQMKKLQVLEDSQVVGYSFLPTGQETWWNSTRPAVFLTGQMQDIVYFWSLKICTSDVRLLMVLYSNFAWFALKAINSLLCSSTKKKLINLPNFAESCWFSQAQTY